MSGLNLLELGGDLAFSARVSVGMVCESCLVGISCWTSKDVEENLYQAS